MRFTNRRDAGRALAERLADYAGRSDVIVLALPRGGVPVAYEVARALGASLDLFLVRKLGVPGHPEFAMGAIAEGGTLVLNEELIARLGVPRVLIDQIASRERLEMERRDVLYRNGRRTPHVRDRVVILIDDGLATGSTMEAAIVALRREEPSRIIVAAPVGARETCDRLLELSDHVVCLHTPQPFDAVGLWYEDFSQTTDDEVRELLAAAGRVTREPAAGRRSDALSLVRERAHRLSGDDADFDRLIDVIGDARLVLLGEATHGTHEFYRERARITQRLIEERGFAGVAVEADWPDAYRVNRYVRGERASDHDAGAEDALRDFQRFPTWMWRNADVVEFVGWLRAFNETRPADTRAGFYGLDLYSLRASMEAVVSYLTKVDPEAARRARARYACFDHFSEEPQQYAYATSYGWSPSCEQEVLSQLLDLHRRAADYASRDGRIAADEYFFAEQNARLVKNAEEYYRTVMSGRADSWNLRDRHMMETLRELLRYLDRTGARQPAKLVVWAHNSHLGDARATTMSEAGEWNVGQLVREEYGAQAILVGFTTHTGTVTAASDWGGVAQRKYVRPSMAGSCERLFHDTDLPRFMLSMRTDPDLASALHDPRLQRAIGVIYLPESERRSHYFAARLSQQFDVVIHVDQTRALEPLERTSTWEAGELAETYPTGL